ncbi:MAG: isoprenyl transferase [Candidatus Omnitrophota bacterium]|nr:isoprenyl transferase [Candidatus Omnitrophota bacterium]
MDDSKVPMHVAIIMDGNGRWAQARHLTRTQGHIEGVKRVEEITQAALKAGVKVLTLYAFSTENWSRPPDEVSMLMRTLVSALNQKAKELHVHGVRIRFIGRRQGVPDHVRTAIRSAETMTGADTAMTLNVAFNYGSRAEIADAVKGLAADVKAGRLGLEDISEETLGRYLYTAGQPDPDILIRTSGEQRISNFLLWQLSYAELYFTDKFWPEFTVQEFHKALAEFAGRQRRYGGVK